MELLYGLISDNFEELFPLLESRNGDRPSDTLLSVLIEAVTDFAVVVFSNKMGIVSVVEASSYQREDGEIMLEDRGGNALKAKVPFHNYEFDVKKLEPLITSRARFLLKGRI